MKQTPSKEQVQTITERTPLLLERGRPQGSYPPASVHCGILFCCVVFQALNVPFLYSWCNAADLTCKACLLLFCVAACACIDHSPDKVDLASLPAHRALFGDICLATFGLGVTILMIAALQYFYFRFLAARGRTVAEKVKMMHRFRDAALVVAGLPNKEFNALADQMPQADLSAS